MAQKIFKRYELKYLLNETQFKLIQKELNKHMVLDEFCEKNGSYMIYNVYFDTKNDEIIRKSLSKPYYKEKLRLRSYKNPIEKEDTVFLEIKKKIGSIISKRRVTMTYEDAMSFTEKGIRPNLNSYTDRQIINEITDFLDRYDAKPKVYLSYERIAFYDKENHQFRVTFDKDILSRRDKPNLTEGDYGTEILNEGSYLMEVKIYGSMALWFAQLLSELKIYSTSFSKYGAEYKNYVKLQNSKTSTPQTIKTLSQVLEQRFTMDYKEKCHVR